MRMGIKLPRGRLVMVSFMCQLGGSFWMILTFKAANPEGAQFARHNVGGSQVGPTQSVEGLNRTKRPTSLSKGKFCSRLPRDFIYTVGCPGSLPVSPQAGTVPLALLGLEPAGAHSSLELASLQITGDSSL